MRRIQLSERQRPNGVRLFAALIFLLPIAAQSLSAQSLDAVYARLDKSAQQFKSLTADIKRDVHTAIVNDDSIENGSIKVKREKSGTRMLIDFVTPDKKTIALDGDTGSVYYPKIKTVQIYNVGEKRSMVDQILLLGFGATSDELKTAYDMKWIGAEQIDGKPTNHIQLIPKSKDILTRIKKAELWISDSTGTPLRQRFVTSASGDSMLVTYSDVKLNPAIPDGALKLTYPKGVRIEHPQL
jgi:outer membrane lipoprotein-sorting protein